MPKDWKRRIKRDCIVDDSLRIGDWCLDSTLLFWWKVIAARGGI